MLNKFDLIESTNDTDDTKVQSNNDDNSNLNSEDTNLRPSHPNNNENNNNILHTNMKPNMCYNTLRKYADNVAATFFGQGKANIASTLQILDMISNCNAIKNDLNGIKIDECVRTVLEMKSTFIKLHKCHDKQSKLQQQVLLSAMTIIESKLDESDETKDDNNEQKNERQVEQEHDNRLYHDNNIRKRKSVFCNIKNKSLMYNFLNKNVYTMHKIENIKRRFNSKISLLLYF